jgi:hypothetical protein
MRRARRFGAALLATLALLLCSSNPAGAQAYDYGWALTAYGSAHSVLTANHFMTERRDGLGGWNGHINDYWLPWFCHLHAIHWGNGVGVPMRIQFIPPAGWGVGCRPGYDQSGYGGWTTGTGHYEGQHYTTGYTARRVFYIPGRNPASPDAYGTEIEVF